MGIKTRFKRFFELEDDVQEVERESFAGQEELLYEDNVQARPDAKTQNVVSLKSVKKSAEVILLEPRTYDEAQEIADHLKDRRAVIINLQRISHEQAKRIVDFLSGTVYAIEGDIQKLGADIFLCAPDNVDVSGTISEMYDQFQS